MDNLRKGLCIGAIALASSAVTYSLVACNAMPVRTDQPVMYTAALEERVVTPPESYTNEVRQPPTTRPAVTVIAGSPDKDYLALKLNIEVDCRIDDIVRKYQDWRAKHKKLFD